MSTIIAKFSDFLINPIEYFIEKIEDSIKLRDIGGLTKGRVELVNVSKSHPLVTLMESQLSEVRNADPLRSSLIPMIGVTSGNSTDEGFTLGKSYKPSKVDDDFINQLKTYIGMTEKEIQSKALITQSQIETILGEYKRLDGTKMLIQENQWLKNEEIHLSVWTPSPDLDVVFGQLMDSILADIQIGFLGDNSVLRNFKYSINKGLTNFNFGRVLYGIEYTMTLTNNFNNFTLFIDDDITEHDSNFETIIPGGDK